MIIKPFKQIYFLSTYWFMKVI